MLKKLRWKFVLINMFIVTVMLIVILGLVSHFTRADLEKQSRTTVRDAAQAALQLGHPEPSGDQRTPCFTLRINALGMVTARGSAYYDLSDEEFLQTLLQAVYEGGQTEGVLENYQLRYAVASGFGEQCIAFVDISGQQATMAALLRTGVLIGCVSLVAFLGISLLLARWAVRPVEQAWQQQKQFVSDASHELKTPLTVIMSSAELLRTEQCDDESRLRFADSILTVSHQMRKLVEGLLELARADNGQIRKAFRVLDISELVSHTLLPHEPVLYEQGLQLHSNVEPEISVRGSEQYLGQLLDILLDNARKYSAPGIVSVGLRRQGRMCLLTVDNPGSPIPEAERERIFDRFYRIDQARERTGSFGLGLAIAKSIALEHGGRIWVESNPTGNRFCVQLPINQ